jgi:hypothetical protein
MSTTKRFELAQAAVESRLRGKDSSTVTEPTLLTVPVQGWYGHPPKAPGQQLRM